MNAQPTPLAEAIGGVRGMVETSAPALAFVIAYVASGSSTETAAAVAVGLAVDGADAVLRVGDDGPGVASEDRDRIFERFARADEARRAGDGGACARGRS